MNGKILVHTAQTSNEMILEGANGTLGSIVSMNVRWGKLEIHVLSNKEEVFECIRAFIAKAMQTGA